MGRSLKKGPFVDPKLMKRIEQMNDKSEKKVIRTWSRARRFNFPQGAYRGRKVKTGHR